MFWVWSLLFLVVLGIVSYTCGCIVGRGPRSDYPSPSVYRFPVVRPWWK